MSNENVIVIVKTTTYLLREKCPYSELFWSVFSRIRTEYGEVQSISLYSVRMRENADHNNSEYGHFLRSDWEDAKIKHKKQNFKKKWQNFDKTRNVRQGTREF